jgi:hypothetical protein
VVPLQIDVIDVNGFHRSSGHGGSRSFVVRSTDGRLVLVKLKGNPQSTRALFGEWIATLLGRKVGAAFPQPVLVRIPYDAVAQIPALRDRPWIPGLQLGLVFHPDATPLEPAAAPSLVNLDRLPVTALTEVWLYNVDLKRDHVLAVASPAGAELLVVDHGHVFVRGPDWRPADLRRAADGQPDLRALHSLGRAAGRPLRFKPAVDACASVEEKDLNEVLDLVPAEWGLHRGEAVALREFLMRRRQHLPRWAADLARQWSV